MFLSNKYPLVVIVILAFFCFNFINKSCISSLNRGSPPVKFTLFIPYSLFAISYIYAKSSFVSKFSFFF